MDDVTNSRPPCELHAECSKAFLTVDHRLNAVERRIRREGSKSVVATLIQTAIWAALTIYAIERGAAPPSFPVSEAHAAQKANP